jgi:hypothetical protein
MSKLKRFPGIVDSHLCPIPLNKRTSTWGKTPFTKEIHNQQTESLQIHVLRFIKGGHDFWMCTWAFFSYDRSAEACENSEIRPTGASELSGRKFLPKKMWLPAVAGIFRRYQFICTLDFNLAGWLVHTNQLVNNLFPTVENGISTYCPSLHCHLTPSIFFFG